MVVPDEIRDLKSKFPCEITLDSDGFDEIGEEIWLVLLSFDNVIEKESEPFWSVYRKLNRAINNLQTYECIDTEQDNVGCWWSLISR